MCKRNPKEKVTCGLCPDNRFCESPKVRARRQPPLTGLAQSATIEDLIGRTLPIRPIRQEQIIPTPTGYIIKIS